jgi:hypothetical protein
MFDLAPQTGKNSVDVLIVVVGALEEIVKISDLLNSYLFVAGNDFPLLGFSANDAVDLYPVRRLNQSVEQFLGYSNITVPMAPVAPNMRAFRPSSCI